MSHTTASALRVMGQAGLVSSKVASTAFFLELINNCFDVMNCRHPRTALYSDSDDKLSLLMEVSDEHYEGVMYQSL